jgi:cysteine synthase A
MCSSKSAGKTPKAKSILCSGGKPLKWKPKKGLAKLSKEREKLFKELMKIPGHTSLESLVLPNGNRIFVKMEFENKPTGSHYDRVYPILLCALERTGINPEKFVLVETSSGNATPAFGYFAGKLGYETIAFLPAEISEKRKNLTRRQCGKTVIADPEKQGWGVFGAANAMHQALAENKEERRKNPGKKAFYCVNHSQVTESLQAIKTAAKEIVKQLKGKKPDYFLGIAGNGVILYGVGLELKKHFPKMKVIAIEAFERPVLYPLKYPGRYEKNYHRKPPSIEDMHGKEFFAPGTGAIGVQFPHLYSAAEITDDIMLIRKEEMQEALEELSKKGYKVGHTSAMSFSAAKKLAEKEREKSMLIIFYDTIDRY